MYQRDEADVDHGYQRQRDDKPGEVMARIGQDRQDEAHEAVRSDLQRDGGEDDRAAGRRFDVRVGQPGVHRPHRHLDRERDEECGEQPFLRLERQRQLIPLEDREAAADGVQIDQRDQHQHRAQERVEKELERGVDAVRAAPDADDEVHRDQLRFEEDVEQHGVERGEHTVDEPRHDEERRHILGDSRLDDHPTGPDGEHGDEAVEQDEEDRYSIDAEEVIDAEARDPFDRLDELHLGGAKRELRIERNRYRESGDSADERQPARRGRVAVAVDREHEKSGDDRYPDRQAQVGQHQTTRSVSHQNRKTTIPRTMANAY